MPKEKNLPVKAKSSDSTDVKDYSQTLADLKRQIHEAQIKAAVAVNRELARLYWNIGRTIAEKQEVSGWGTKLIEKLAKDLQNAFPGIEGFSRTNVFRMRAFYLAYCNCLTAVGQLKEDPPEVFLNIPWGHNFILLDKLKGLEERLWYANKTIANGWSRNVLLHWIDSGLFNREGKAITNFHLTLPKSQSDLAQQTLKNPYILDFLDLKEDHDEKELEAGLVKNIQRFLLELGAGFSFVGRQYRIEVSGKEYIIDLLFYNFISRCFFVVELKAREFDPRDIGQLNFYLSAVDDMLRHKDDQSSIGILMCKSRDHVTVEYALRNSKSPIGVSVYTTELFEKLPNDLKRILPTIEELENELKKDFKHE